MLSLGEGKEQAEKGECHSGHAPWQSRMTTCSGLRAPKSVHTAFGPGQQRSDPSPPKGRLETPWPLSHKEAVSRSRLVP